ncbi:MAG: hypothetical protein HKN63_11080 [Rhodobacteraceae bacterium]|nr:hypothetical protein [Paracoccaceae bacterium]
MKALFVVGTGRSGTHFTVRVLNGFENTYDPMAGRENSGILRDVARAAIHHRLPSKKTTKYYQDLLGSQTGVLLDQHHPNLFFADHWCSIFNDLVFLYVERPTYQVVASMLRHRGVMDWYRYATSWRQRLFNPVPYPNQFLGIKSASEIQSLPVHLLCAHRVVAHKKQFERQSLKLNGALRSINYEALVTDQSAELSRVFSSDEIELLGEFSIIEKPRRDSLSKYLDVLSENEIEEISAFSKSSNCE